MRVELNVPDTLMKEGRNPSQVAQEVRRALAAYWLARGEVSPEELREILAEPEPVRDFKAALLAMPDVGDDADFERITDIPRQEIQWDT